MIFTFIPIIILCRSREEHIASAVECGLDRVLHHADDEADGDCLHGHIIADAEERAGHWNKQQ